MHAMPGSWCSAECAPWHPQLLAGWDFSWETAPGHQAKPESLLGTAAGFGWGPARVQGSVQEGFAHL